MFSRASGPAWLGRVFGELLCFGRKLSRLLGSRCEWWLLLLLGSWSFLFSILVPGLVRLIDLFLEVVPRGSDASSIDGKDRCLVSPARVEKRGRIRGSSGRIATHGAWIQLALTGARVRTAQRPHEVERFEICYGFQLTCPLSWSSLLKASATISWVCVCVCVRVSVGPSNK